MTRGPRTRRQHSLARKRQDNEQRSMLLQLNDDVLEKVLSFLEGRDLAVLETVCTHFRYGSWVAVNRVAMPETSAKRKLESLELGEMPPGFRCEDGIFYAFAVRTTFARNALFPRHRPRGRDPIRDSSSAARPSRHHCRSVAPAEPFVFSPRRPASAVRRHFDAPTSSRLFRKRGISAVCVSARPGHLRLASPGNSILHHSLFPLTTRHTFHLPSPQKDEMVAQARGGGAARRSPRPQ